MLSTVLLPAHGEERKSQVFEWCGGLKKGNLRAKAGRPVDLFHEQGGRRMNWSAQRRGGKLGLGVG